MVSPKLIFFTLLIGVYCDIIFPDMDAQFYPKIPRNHGQPTPIPLAFNIKPVKVNLSVHILYFSVNTAKQEFDITMYFRQGWKDSRLAFSSPEPCNFRMIADDTSIWTPDLFFVNEVVRTPRLTGCPLKFIRIFPDGTVFSSQRITVKASCPMDLTTYPFDTQTCPLEIESYGYTTKDLILGWNMSSDNPITGDPTAIEFSVNMDWRTYLITFKGNEYGRTTIEFTLKRNPSLIFFRIFLPVSTIMVFSYASFFFNKRETCIRLTLCLSPIITFLLQVNFSSNFFMRPGYPTCLDIWVSFCFIAMLAAFFEFIYVANRTVNQDEEEDDYDEDGHGKMGSNDIIDIRARFIFACSFLLFNTFCVIYVSLAQYF